MSRTAVVNYERIKKELKEKNLSPDLIENITNKIQPCKGQQKKNL